MCGILSGIVHKVEILFSLGSVQGFFCSSVLEDPLLTATEG